MWNPNWISKGENYNIWVENILDGINEKLDIVDEKISESEDIAVEIIQMKHREKV